MRDTNGNTIIVGATVLLDVEAWERFLDKHQDDCVTEDEKTENPDYNVFIVDFIWENSREVGLRQNNYHCFVPHHLIVVSID